mgnify:CR=1 FL=1
MDQDKRILAAKAHWSGRMVTNGVPLSDFQDILASISVWKDWCRKWSEKGDFHKELATTALAENKTISAGSHYKTASLCYHFGKFLFVDYPEEMAIAHTKAVECYNAALPLLSPPGERIEIPYDGKNLYGNLRIPIGSSKPPVVIMIVGLDSTKEEMFTYERDFLERGIATFAFDGPGQGEGEYDFTMCPEYEKPVAAVISKLSDIKTIDAESIGLWGVSMGGYYAPRAAAFCNEIRACIALSGPFDLSLCFDKLPELTASAVIHRSGSKSRSEIELFINRMSLSTVAEKIKCPLYIVSGALDKVIPPEHSKMLERAAVNSTHVHHQIVENGGHVANNRAYAYRYNCADWMRKNLIV